jgi:spore coat protein A
VFQPVTPGGTHYDIGVHQFKQNLGLWASNGSPLETTLWGYGNSLQAPTYPGRTFIVQKDQPVTVQWRNGLTGAGGAALPHLLPVDSSIHWANPNGWPASGVPIVTHLHGGHSRSESDGLPDAWFTPNYGQRGRLFNPINVYDNDQEAATLWYHDHALGITRLNVYAGLAGFYLLRDANEASLNLPQFPYEVPIVIQDRMFTAAGELFMPSEPEVDGSPDPSVLPEFFGDIILVNGQAWPVLDVEPRRYRLRLLNGSDSRFYNLFLASGQPFVQIGSDAGLLSAPVTLAQLTLGPGERADVIVDFAGWAGQSIVLRNNAKTPYPSGETINPRTVGQIMAFRVSKPLTGADTSSVPANLRPLHGPIEPLLPVAKTRQLLLFEGTDQYGRLMPMLGTLSGGPMMWDDPVTEDPQLNDIEVWEVFNLTEDAHPIHLHLVRFQILNRQKIHASGMMMSTASDVRIIGQPRPPEPNERGWKDTALMFPGEVTRIAARFDREGEYVWHCHILSHEDNEMMRPFVVR